MNLAVKLDELVELYAPITDAQERMAVLVESRSQRTQLPENERADSLRVPACISAAWIACTVSEGRCLFRCAADSPLVSGLLSCLCEFYSDATPAEIEAAGNLDPLATLGISKNLSPTRLNGLSSARKRILSLAQTAA